MDKNSPICVLKNQLVLPLESLQHVEAPFSFLIAGRGRIVNGVEVREFDVEPGDKVFYFQRKRMRLSKGIVVAHYVYRICIGRVRADGTDDRHWISPDGDYIEPNVEPLKERK